MSHASTVAIPKDEVIIVKAADLPLHCPGPDTPLWNMHPRVYIDMSQGEATCPYCSARFRLEDGAKPHGH